MSLFAKLLRSKWLKGSRRRKNPHRPRLNLEPLEVRSLLASVLTYHNDAGKTGQNTDETVLTRQNVNVNTFGKVFTVALDGEVYAQPLVVEDVNITVGPHAGVHDAVFVPTQHGSLYAIDGSTGAVLWQRNLLDVALPGATAVRPVFRDDVGSGYPETVTTGTPVIDATTSTLYLLTKTVETVNGQKHFVQRVHAINIADGTSRVAPFLIGDTINHGNERYTNNSPVWVHGTGDGNDGNGHVFFNAMRQHTRTALTLFKGVVYAGWASHESRGPYHGWVVGWDAQTLALRTVFCTTPNGGLGGIWQSGGGFATDGEAMYFQTANGSFGGNNGNLVSPQESGTVTGLDANGFPANGNYSNSILKVVPDPTTNVNNQNLNGWGLKVVDYFTPFNQKYLEETDLDLGSGAPMLLPPEAGSPEHPNLLIGAGKQGIMYLVDRDNMGKFGTKNHNVQTVGGQLSGSFDTPAYYDNKIYYVEGFGGTAKTFSIINGVISEEPTSRSHDTYTYAGSTPSISSNGDQNGIVWDIDRGTNQLRAYSTDSYAQQLYHSGQAAGNRDFMGTSPTFQVPTVANGFVYLGTASGSSSTLVAYGLIEPPTASPAAPSNLKATSILGTQVNLTWQANDSSPNIATGYLVEKSTDGGATWTGIPAGTATSFTVGGLQLSTTYKFRVSAYNTIGSSATSSVLTITTTADAGGVDYSGGFDATTADVMDGDVQVENGALVLTNGEPNLFRGVFTKTKQDITKFSTTFDFLIAGGPSANGFTFTIQSDDPSVDAGGWQSGGSEGLAYGSVNNAIFPHSMAIKFDLFRAIDVYEYSGAYISTTGLYFNGSMPTTPELDLIPAGIDLHSGHKMRATVDYDSASKTLRLTIEDTVTGIHFDKQFTDVDLLEAVGGGSAYVGFTAASGRNADAAGDQRILNWKFAPQGPPTPPTNLRTQMLGQTPGAVDFPPLSVKLEWTGVEDATGYKIERRFGLVGNYQVIATVPAGTTSYNDAAVGTQVNYYYRLKATNGAGDSAYSEEVVATTPGRVPTPRFGTATAVTATSIAMQWTDFATNEDGFHIVRRSGASPYVLVGVLPPNPGTGVMTFVDTGLDPETNYDYHIQAFNLVGYSDYSGVNTDTPALSGPPQAYFQYLSTPRNTDAGNVLLHFSSAVTGFFKSDLKLTRDGVDVSLTNATVTKIADDRYSIDLSSVTAPEGDYVLTLAAAGSGIVDGSNNPLANDAQLAWTKDSTSPSVVSFEQVVPAAGVSLTNSETLVYVLQFSEPVTAPSLHSAISFGLSVQDPVITTTDNQTFTITFEQLAGTGTLSVALNANSNPIKDSAGNLLSTSSYPEPKSIAIDRAAPSVTASTILIEKGLTRTLVPAMLLATDARVSLDGIQYVIQSLPQHVTIERGGIALQVGDIFTQLDINTLHIVLRHDDASESTDSMTFTATDGLNQTAVQTLSFSIVPFNSTPTVTSVAVQRTNFETEFIVGAATGTPLQVIDSDAGNDPLRITLGANNGQLTLATTEGLTFQIGNGVLNAAMTFEGTLADINRALAGMRFTPRIGFTGLGRITLVANDLGNNGTRVEKISQRRFVQVQILPWEIHDNTLRFAGVIEDDTLNVSVDAGQIRITTAATSYDFPRADIHTISVFGYSGNDEINIHSTGGLLVKVFGADGDDTVTVAESVTSNVVLNGGNGDDILIGGAGNDSLTGGDGSDRLVGGLGDDRYVFHNVVASAFETDTIVELAGGGVDLVNFATITTSVSIDLRNSSALATHALRKVVMGAAGQSANIESAGGGSGDDTIHGNAANNWLGGAIGDDVLSGFDGHDGLYGGEGNDTLIGGNGSDKLQGNQGNDRYVFAAVTAIQLDTDIVAELTNQGVDTLDFSALAINLNVDLTSDAELGRHSLRKIVTQAAGQAVNFENVIGGSGKDALSGNARANTLSGNDGDDTLLGRLGNDLLLGGAGSDRLTGGFGSDRLAGGLDNDFYIFADATGFTETDVVEEFADSGEDALDFAALTTSVSVNLGVTWTVASHNNRKVLMAAAGQNNDLEVIVGGSANDQLTGNSADNWIGGNDGDDVISGGGGNDMLAGREGDDQILGGTGNDRLIGGDGDDSLAGGQGDDSYKFQAVTGGMDEADTVTEYAGGGTDVLDFGELLTSVTINLNQIDIGSHALRTVRVGALSQAAHLEIVLGGIAADSLTGNAAANVLVGNGGGDQIRGGGRDVLIGGQGADSLQGDIDQDVLIAGQWMFQNDSAGLTLLRNAWSQPTAYEARIDQLLSAGSFAVNATTIIEDTELDSLLGAGEIDWFWANSDEIEDLVDGERRDP